jgi:two-component system response regulator
MDAVQEHSILLIEDNPDHASIIEQAFRACSSGVKLRIVQNAEEATAYLLGVGPYGDRSQFALPRLILLDLNLPGRSGIQFVEWLRQREDGRCLPVIALTGVGDYEFVKKAFAAGVNSYIEKPGEFEELKSAIALVLKYWLVLSARPA